MNAGQTFRKKNILVMCAVALLFTASAQATTYNPVQDFSITSNPAGVWSYLSDGHLLPTPVPHFGDGGLDVWETANQTIPNAAYVGINTTSGPLGFLTIVVPADSFWLGAETPDADLRFTAPANGTYTIAGNFVGIDVGDVAHPVEVLEDGAIIFSATIAKYGQDASFTLVRSLTKGDTIDFDSLTGATYTNLSTGFTGSIVSSAAPPAPVPEPESAAFLICGLSTVALCIRKRKL